MDTYSLNVNIEEEVKSYGVEDKLNDYIAVQKQVIPILEKENFYGCVKNETTGVEIDVSINGVLFKITIDIKKTKEKNKFWMHNIRITEKNSQLLSPAQCQDVHETGNSCNHIIAQKNENASENFYKDSESEKTMKIPYYDSTSHTWKLITELGLEEVDATYFSIDGFEEYYSEQERELLNCLKVKLRKNFREN